MARTRRKQVEAAAQKAAKDRLQGQKRNHDQRLLLRELQCGHINPVESGPESLAEMALKKIGRQSKTSP